MRRSSLAIVLMLLVLPSGVVLGEATRTLRVSLTGDAAAPFAIENLAGAMTVLPSDGEGVTAVATIHAEDDTLAAMVRFEQVRNEEGVATLRVIYPLDRERTLRYPLGTKAEGGSEEGGRHRHTHWFSILGWDSSEMKYDGHRVRVSADRGALLYADVEVRVPRRALDATFRNLIGTLQAEGIEGHILLDTARGDVTARRLKGEVKADTGSGDVHGSDLQGSFVCDTGSGACEVTGFVGSELSCDTGSGEVRIRDVKAERLIADTGSGRIRARAVDVEEFHGDTGSGGIEAELIGPRLRRIRADTGSGEVTLRLPADATFEADADQGSGGLRCGFHDAEKVTSDHKVVGFRRGDRKVRISIDTGSGDATIEPVS
jgi:hypothetical protein